MKNKIAMNNTVVIYNIKLKIIIFEEIYAIICKILIVFCSLDISMLSDKKINLYYKIYLFTLSQ